MTVRATTGLVAAVLACACAAAGAAPRVMDRATRSPGKPTAPMAIDFALAAEPAPGALLEISIEVRAPGDVGNLALDARADDGRTLLVASQAPVAGKRGAWIVTVVPLADGTSYLNVSVQGTIGTETQTRSVAIPVRAGGGPAAAAVPRSTEGGGTKQARTAARAPTAGEGAAERVVLLPVIETTGAAPK
jgi:hypothetical protein